MALKNYTENNQVLRIGVTKMDCVTQNIIYHRMPKRKLLIEIIRKRFPRRNQTTHQSFNTSKQRFNPRFFRTKLNHNKIRMSDPSNGNWVRNRKHFRMH